MNVAELFLKLKAIARQSRDESTLGLAGWAAEANQGNDIIRYFQYDGGYSQKLISDKFQFIIWENNSNTESVYRFDRGSIEDMINCLEFLNEKKL